MKNEEKKWSELSASFIGGVMAHFTVGFAMILGILAGAKFWDWLT